MPTRVLVPFAVVLAAVSCEGSPGVPSPLVNPGDVLSITLESGGPGPEVKVILEDPAAIGELLSLARFRRKPPCPCAHFESLTVQTRRGTLTARICDHCFDLFEGSSCTNYEMSPAFRARYLALLEQASPATGR